MADATGKSSLGRAAAGIACRRIHVALSDHRRERQCTADAAPVPEVRQRCDRIGGGQREVVSTCGQDDAGSEQLYHRVDRTKKTGEEAKDPRRLCLGSSTRPCPMESTRLRSSETPSSHQPGYLSFAGRLHKMKCLLLVVAAVSAMFSLVNPAFTQTWIQNSALTANWSSVAISADGGRKVAGVNGG